MQYLKPSVDPLFPPKRFHPTLFDLFDMGKQQAHADAYTKVIQQLPNIEFGECRRLTNSIAQDPTSENHLLGSRKGNYQKEPVIATDYPTQKAQLIAKYQTIPDHSPFSIEYLEALFPYIKRDSLTRLFNDLGNSLIQTFDALETDLRFYANKTEIANFSKYVSSKDTYPIELRQDHPTNSIIALSLLLSPRSSTSTVSNRDDKENCRRILLDPSNSQFLQQLIVIENHLNEKKSAIDAAFKSPQRGIGK